MLEDFRPGASVSPSGGRHADANSASPVVPVSSWTKEEVGVCMAKRGKELRQGCPGFKASFALSWF